MPHLNYNIDVITIFTLLAAGVFAFKDRFQLVKELAVRQEKFEAAMASLTNKITELTLALSELRVEFHEYRKANEKH